MKQLELGYGPGCYTRDGLSTAAKKDKSSLLQLRSMALQHTVRVFVYSCTEGLAVVVVSTEVKHLQVCQGPFASYG